MTVIARRWLALLIVVIAAGCARGTANIAPDHELAPGHGLLLGSFSMRGYAGSPKPQLHLERTGAGARASIAFDRNFFGREVYDFGDRSGKVFALQLPAGEYRFTATTASNASMAAGVYIHIGHSIPSALPPFVLEAGKVTYVGDLYYLYGGGFLGLAPQIHEMKVTDRFDADAAALRAKFHRLGEANVVKRILSPGAR